MVGAVFRPQGVRIHCFGGPGPGRDQQGLQALAGSVLPPAQALRVLPEARLSPAEAVDLAHGRSMSAGAHREGLVRAVDGEGRLVAVCEVAGGRLRPVRVLLAAADARRTS